MVTSSYQGGGGGASHLGTSRGEVLKGAWSPHPTPGRGEVYGGGGGGPNRKVI